MTVAAFIVRVCAASALALVAAMPWSAGEVGRLALPFLPMLAIIYWCADETPALPATGVFVIGLFSDAATQSPIGFWTTTGLVSALVTRGLWQATRPVSHLGRVTVLIVGVLVVALVSWGLTYLYAFETKAAALHLAAAAMGVAALLPVTILLAVVDSGLERRKGAQPLLGRGRL